MKPYYQDLHNTLYNIDFRKNDLPDESVQMVVTSPPYWGLRKYSGEQELIWGDKDCEHQWIDNTYVRNNDQTAGEKQRTNVGAIGRDEPIKNGFCSLCGAWKGAYGLEPTPEMYVKHTIEILREIRRVLRKDGVVFWNIGDSYWGGGRGADGKYANEGLSRDSLEVKPDWSKTNLKPKDLCLIPFRVAIAAQEDGWWVRSVIIWSKNNPMPESVTDRPTNSHEYILMLTKSKKYYWDAEAVREKLSPETMPRLLRGVSNHHKNVNGAPGQTPHTMSQPREHGEGYANINPSGRNIRSVWEFPTQPYPEAHFAVFPEKLPELCIKAASKPGDIVLDPFAGAGTTLWVAKKLNRKAVGYEISEEYCELIVKRNRQQVMV